MKTRILALLVVFALMAGLAACGSSGTPQSSASQAATTATSAPASSSAPDTQATLDPFGKYDQQVTFTLGRQDVSGNNLPKGDTLDNNQFTNYVQQRLNVKINVAFAVADGEAYKQKVNLIIASNDLPDVLHLTDDSQLRRLVDSGLVEDLAGAYNQYASPLIREYYDSYKGAALNTTTYDGKLLALPNTNILGNYQLLWARKDWMDKLGLQAPKTIEEVFAMAKAFAEKDPDGNGKADTVGLLGSAEPLMYGDGAFFAFDPVFNALGAYPANWVKDAAGNVIYGSTAPEAKTALAKLGEAYASGAIDKEFMTRKWDDNAALVSSGKAGILFAPWYAGWMLSDSVKNNPKADWVPITSPLDTNGKRNIIASKPTSQYLVVKKGFAHPDAIIKTLNVEYQGIRLLDAGTEELYKGLGVSWLNYPLPLQLDDYNNLQMMQGWFKDGLAAKDRNKVPARARPTYDSIVNEVADPKKNIADYANYLAFYIGGAQVGIESDNVMYAAYYGQTPTMLTRMTNLQKLENEAFLRIVLGQEPADSFDKFVSDWKAQGGDQISKEVADAVSNKK